MDKNNTLSFEKIISDLNNFKESIEKIDYIHDKEKFFEIMREFRTFIGKDETNAFYDVIYHSKHYEGFKNFFSNVNLYYIRTLESVQALSIITKGLANKDNFINLIDRDLIKEAYLKKKEEIQSINFNGAKSLVLAGSGPMPETLLYIYENTNIEDIIGLDNNSEAIFLSGEMLSGLGLSKIKLLNIDAEKYDYFDSDIVYIPLFTNPKNKILDRIVETGNDRVQILVNLPKGLSNLFYDGYGELNPRLKIDYRSDLSSLYRSQEIVKLVKYNF